MRFAPLPLLSRLTAAAWWLLANTAAADEVTPKSVARVPVLLELFTSEGCSSCPPADLALARLLEGQPIPGVEVVALSEHVDYWNRLGWADPYSAPLFSERQETYAPRVSAGRVYTPQVVVDGVSDLSWHDEAALRRGLAAAAVRRRGTLVLQARAEAAGKVELTLELRGVPDGGELLLAVVEDGLVSRVTAGENQGRTLPHAAVVRWLRALGRASAGDSSHRAEVALDPAWQRGRLRLVAFVQQPGRPVQAAGALALGR